MKNIPEIQTPAQQPASGLLRRLIPLFGSGKDKSQQLGGFKGANVGGHGQHSSQGPRVCTASTATATANASTPACDDAATTNATRKSIGESYVSATPDLGYCRNLEVKYSIGPEVGRGGNGLVRLVTDLSTGVQYACKSINKVLPAKASQKKKEDHVDSIRREVEVLRRLAGSLQVVQLQHVFEDHDHVHVVMEYCKGGELWHRCVTASRRTRKTLAQDSLVVSTCPSTVHRECVFLLVNEGGPLVF